MLEEIRSRRSLCSRLTHAIARHGTKGSKATRNGITTLTLPFLFLNLPSTPNSRTCSSARGSSYTRNYVRMLRTIGPPSFSLALWTSSHESRGKITKIFFILFLLVAYQPGIPNWPEAFLNREQVRFPSLLPLNPAVDPHDPEYPPPPPFISLRLFSFTSSSSSFPFFAAVAPSS